MNFKEERSQRKAEQIEQILKQYLPETRGRAGCHCGSDGVQPDGRRKTAAPVC